MDASAGCFPIRNPPYQDFLAVSLVLCVLGAFTQRYFHPLADLGDFSKDLKYVFLLPGAYGESGRFESPLSPLPKGSAGITLLAGRALRPGIDSSAAFTTVSS